MAARESAIGRNARALGHCADVEADVADVMAGIVSGGLGREETGLMGA